MTEKCNICPRKCNARRQDDNVGYCGVGADLQVARAALHYWEEPCISGEAGSGTVFFSGCNLRCVFCQNQNISRGKAGKVITADRLTEIFLEQQQRGALNINLVTASHYVNSVAEAIKNAKANGLKIPILWNSSAYESVEALKSLAGLVDIYLPDFKYVSSEIAARYSKAADYFTVASAALAEMHRQQPQVYFDDNGIMTKGCLVRHLLLPNCLEDSKNTVKYLYEKYGDSVYLSLMAQYTPFGDLSEYPEIDRKIYQWEYDELVDYAVELGVENAFVQSFEAADESFIPEFDCRGV